MVRHHIHAVDDSVPGKGSLDRELRAEGGKRVLPFSGLLYFDVIKSINTRRIEKVASFFDHQVHVLHECLRGKENERLIQEIMELTQDIDSLVTYQKICLVSGSKSQPWVHDGDSIFGGQCQGTSD